MPESINSSFVFVGGEFAASIFDERSLAEHMGTLDSQNQIKVGPIGQFSYDSGRFHFLTTPDRVSISSTFDRSYLSKFDPNGSEPDVCRNPAIIPERLLAATKAVVRLLEQRGTVRVSGVGINCETVFDQQEINQSGIEFCDSNLINPRSKDLIASESVTASSSRFNFEREKIRFEVRIEPHSASRGQNLFTAVNAHQDVDEGENLVDKIAASVVDEVKDYLAEFYKKILNG